MGECAKAVTTFWQRQRFHDVIVPHRQAISDTHPQHPPNQSQKLYYACPLLTSMASHQTASSIQERLGHAKPDPVCGDHCSLLVSTASASPVLAGHSQMPVVSWGGLLSLCFPQGHQKKNTFKGLLKAHLFPEFLLSLWKHHLSPATLQKQESYTPQREGLFLILSCNP